MKLKLDNNNRILYDGVIDFSTEVYHNIVSNDDENLINDCKKIFNCSEVVENYSEGQTYFIKADSKPRCYLEECALNIFKYHTRNASYDPSQSGAEFWTQVIDHRDDISWHFDRDYGLEEDESMNIHPHLATVTYLTSSGGPTIILDKTSGINISEDISGFISNGVISKPLFGKHLKFDGSKLHAAPSDLKDQDDDEEDDDEDEDDNDEEDEIKKNPLRITFLVNIWLNHIPIQAIALTDNQVAILHHNTGDANGKFQISDSNKSFKREKIAINKQNSVRSLQWTFNHNDFKTVVTIPMVSYEKIQSLFDTIDLIEVDYLDDLKAEVNVTEEEADDGDEESDDNEDDNEDDDKDDDVDETESKPKKRKVN